MCVAYIHICFIDTIVCLDFYFVFETETHYVALSGPDSMDQAGIKLTEIELPLPPACWSVPLCLDIPYFFSTGL